MLCRNFVEGEVKKSATAHDEIHLGTPEVIRSTHQLLRRRSFEKGQRSPLKVDK
jgi:hypothetical protein